RRPARRTAVDEDLHRSESNQPPGAPAGEAQAPQLRQQLPGEELVDTDPQPASFLQLGIHPVVVGKTTVDGRADAGDAARGEQPQRRLDPGATAGEWNRWLVVCD